MENWESILAIILSSGIKFIAGPLLGYSFHLRFLETVLFTWIGMMLSVIIFVSIGKLLREIYFKFVKRDKKENFNKRTRLAINIWRKFGVKGIALLTPLIFTPIGGSLLCTSFKVPFLRIIFFMGIAGLFWAIILTAIVYSVDDARIILRSWNH